MPYACSALTVAPSWRIVQLSSWAVRKQPKPGSRFIPYTQPRQTGVWRGGSAWSPTTAGAVRSARLARNRDAVRHLRLSLWDCRTARVSARLTPWRAGSPPALNPAVKEGDVPPQPSAVIAVLRRAGTPVAVLLMPSRRAPTHPTERRYRFAWGGISEPDSVRCRDTRPRVAPSAGRCDCRLFGNSPHRPETTCGP